MDETNVSDELFRKWQLEVKEDFRSKNYLALPIGELNEECRVDGRSMLSYVKRIEKDCYGMFVAQEKSNRNMIAMQKELMSVKKDLKEAKEHLMEQTIAVNRLTDTLSEFF